MKNRVFRSFLCLSALLLASCGAISSSVPDSFSEQTSESTSSSETSVLSSEESSLSSTEADSSSSESSPSSEEISSSSEAISSPYEESSSSEESILSSEDSSSEEIVSSESHSSEESESLPEVCHVLTLDGTNGKITESYNSKEKHFEALNDSEEPVAFAYLQLMYNTVNTEGFAQFKKSTSGLYNKDSLGTIDSVSAVYDRGSLSVSFARSLDGNWTEETTLSNTIEAPEGGYSYVRFTSPGSASMVRSISIEYHTGGSGHHHSSSSDTSSSGQESSSSSSSYSYSSSSSETERPEINWDMNLNTFGSTFQVTLASKINATRSKTTSYDSCLEIGAQAAAYPYENSKTFIPFYHDAQESEKTTLSACNREHTWPNSRGSKKTGMGADPVMVRPTLSAENNSRGNKFYGLGSNEWDPACCGYEGARGESARVILYCATAYHASGFSLSNSPGDATTLKTMGTLKTLLQWNRDYPPSDFERLVNERYYQMGFARNAFVDHPEYADYIYDENGIRTTSPIE